MVDQSFIGHKLTPMEYEVCRQKILEYVDAIGDVNSAYRDTEVARRLGYPDVIAPPSFAASFTSLPIRQLMSDDALLDRMGINKARLLHGAQTYRYTRPLQAGDRLQVQCEVAEIHSKRNMDIVVINGDVRDVAGQHVLTAITTLIVRG